MSANLLVKKKKAKLEVVETPATFPCVLLTLVKYKTMCVFVMSG